MTGNTPSYHYVVASNNSTPAPGELEATTHLVGCLTTAHEAIMLASFLVRERGFAYGHVIDGDCHLIETVAADDDRIEKAVREIEAELGK